MFGFLSDFITGRQVRSVLKACVAQSAAGLKDLQIGAEMERVHANDVVDTAGDILVLLPNPENSGQIVEALMALTDRKKAECARKRLRPELDAYMRAEDARSQVLGGYEGPRWDHNHELMTSQELREQLDRIKASRAAPRADSRIRRRKILAWGIILITLLAGEAALLFQIYALITGAAESANPVAVFYAATLTAGTLFWLIGLTHVGLGPLVDRYLTAKRRERAALEAAEEGLCDE